MVSGSAQSEGAPVEIVSRVEGDAYWIGGSAAATLRADSGEVWKKDNIKIKTKFLMPEEQRLSLLFLWPARE